MQNNLIALDVGRVRIGVAYANTIARLPSPMTTLEHDEKVWDNILALCKDQNVSGIVVGLPRNLSGNETAQTKETVAFVEDLKKRVNIPVFVQDEAGTSKQAEAELHARGQKKVDKGDIDALAATYILDDFLKSQKEV